MRWQLLKTMSAHGEWVLLKWEVMGEIRYKVGRLDHDGFGFMCLHPFEYFNVQELIGLKAFYFRIKEIRE
jgi:hypothetical protein